MKSDTHWTQINEANNIEGIGLVCAINMKVLENDTGSAYWVPIVTVM